MVENVQRKIFLILTLLVIAALCLLLPEKPFRLGLDLQGGTRLVYRFDFDKALREGQLSEADLADKTTLREEFIRIVRKRIDPNGVLEPVLVSEGEDRVVIELPGISDLSTAEASGKLETLVAADERTELQLAGSGEALEGFPVSGGTIAIGPERLAYQSRDGAKLRGLRRGVQGTAAIEHAAGSELTLVSNDAIKNAIENTGQLTFYLGAQPGDLAYAGTDLERERTKVNAWIEAHRGTSITEFNALPTDQGGPVDRLYWFPHRQEAGAPPLPLEQRIAPLLLSEDPRFRFSGEDLQSAGAGVDNLGLPAVDFRMADARRADFGDFTGENVGRLMGIVLGEEIVTLATIQNRLPGGGIINGGSKGFKNKEVNDIVTLLRSGSLRIKPILEEEERVGASLGDDYVRRGFSSAALGLGLVLLFVVVYYRKLGVFAAITLIVNLILIMGVMAFLKATLTLPGIAGIILTIGMAVDANILIYERIREEIERGGRILQSAKNGFDKALSTIVDANLTTLITGIVLYKIGTGPVRGFATTLIIGILATMFCALVVTRVLVHLSIEKGTKQFTMSQIIGKTRVPFMAKAKFFIPASLVLIAAGAFYFISLPNSEKLSIDFMGGFTVTARTEEPQSVETVRGLIRAIPGEIGKSDVKASLDSGSTETGFTKFRITSKNPEGTSAEADGQDETGESEVRKALAGVLQRGPIELSLAPIEGETQQAATGRLYFEEAHPAADVSAALQATGLTDVSVTDGPRIGVYSFTGKVAADRGRDGLVNALSTAFTRAEDGRGVPYSLASPIPNVASVGAQVVGELRDKALLSILISLFAVVLYVRARFAEYAYGFAAVLALVHDVLITLGILGVVIHYGLIEAEISLPMIAAFLTIIGYSLNDTIVVFDRIRENRQVMRIPLSEILDISINQTLSRTLLTSGTTMITVIVLLVFNFGSGNVLEGFAFALAIGITVGTYSSIFIASPALLWLEKRFGDSDAHPEIAAELARTDSPTVVAGS